jgi:hypothetical protein
VAVDGAGGVVLAPEAGVEEGVGVVLAPEAEVEGVGADVLAPEAGVGVGVAALAAMSPKTAAASATGTTRGTRRFKFITDSQPNSRIPRL